MDRVLHDTPGTVALPRAKAFVGSEENFERSFYSGLQGGHQNLKFFS